jgi:hypothetical protein
VSYGQLWTPEPFYYRNPASIVLAFSILPAPHGVTVRATYTVPAGRALRLHGVAMSMTRTIPAAPSSVMQIIFEAVGVGTILQMEMWTNNTIGDRIAREVAVEGWYGAGRVLRFTTSDSSTGGQMLFHGQAFGTEYDAL